jgi:polygalacturonase
MPRIGDPQDRAARRGGIADGANLCANCGRGGRNARSDSSTVLEFGRIDSRSPSSGAPRNPMIPKSALLTPLLIAALPMLSSCMQAPSAAPTPTATAAAATKTPTPPVAYNVRDFGAVGDGKTLDSPAINQAIEAAAAAGGGTVVFPPGTYLSGSIRMKSKIHLVIGSGATLLGAPQEMNAYDPAEKFDGPAFQDGGHTYFHNSLIWGENLTDVSITGPGMINGGGLRSGDGPQDRISGYSKWRPAGARPLTPEAEKKAEAPDPIPEVRLGNKAIALKLCRNILLRDFTIFHGGHFAVLVTGCDNVTVDNVTMDTNRDGIDIDCCRNTVVSNCRINSPSDDGLCPKSTFALGRNVITENLTITNCQVSGFKEGTLLDGTMQPRPGGNGNGRIKLGTEANGGFRNITISNCTFRSCRGLALEEVDGGIMENITITNITMMDVARYPIYITTGRRNRGPNVTAPSVARNILISNVVASGIEPHLGIIITGLPEQPIEGLRLENIRLVYNGGGTKEQAEATPRELDTGYPEPRGTNPSYGLFARHVRDLELRAINLRTEKPDARPAMMCVDVDGLDIDDFKATVGEGIPLAKFDGVKRLTVRNSPALEAIAASTATGAH